MHMLVRVWKRLQLHMSYILFRFARVTTTQHFEMNPIGEIFVFLAPAPTFSNGRPQSKPAPII